MTVSETSNKGSRVEGQQHTSASNCVCDVFVRGDGDDAIEDIVVWREGPARSKSESVSVSVSVSASSIRHSAGVHIERISRCSPSSSEEI